ncbi:MAG: uroporphyrinogen decarboxylase family protein [Dehalobacterium sp.]
MVKTTFTPEERLNAAIKLAPVDRVPCAPLIDDYAARFAGISNYDFLFVRDKAFDALAQIRARFPVWDIRRSLYHFYYGPHHNKIWVLKNKIPGIDLPTGYEYQLVETVVMKREDYSIIIEKGYHDYMLEFYRRVHGASENAVETALSERQQLLLDETLAAEKCGQINLYGELLVFSGDLISLTRSFPEFIRDTFQIPEVMEEVISLVTDLQIAEYLKTIKKTGIPRIMIGIARMSGQFFSLSFFERFVWPFLKRYVDRFLNAGITPFLHLDGDWSRNLPYFLELPPKSIVLELDGSTDIFKAKQLLKNHCCLLGDVPATLFTIGTQKKVKTYCQRLIDVIGDGGGFILSSGCTLPYKAKHANVAAFFDSISN